MLIVGAVATIGFYQIEVAPKSASSTASSSTSVAAPCTATSCIKVMIIPNAGTTPPGYSPDSITVVIGVNNTVVWSNNDTSGTLHTVSGGTPSSPNTSWGSGPLSEGESFSYTFTVAGTYPYYCEFHPSVMTGTVIVK